MQTLRFDRGERLGHPVEERLDADEAAGRIGSRLRDQMLGAAEADLEPDLTTGDGKQGGRATPAQTIADQRRGSAADVSIQTRLPGPQGLALAASEEGAGRVWSLLGGPNA